MSVVRCYYFDMAPYYCFRTAKKANSDKEMPYCSRCERRERDKELSTVAKDLKDADRQIRLLEAEVVAQRAYRAKKIKMAQLKKRIEAIRS